MESERTIAEQVEALARGAQRASRELAKTDAAQRSSLLSAIAAEIEASRAEILAANEADCAEAATEISAAMLDRLRLTAARFDAMVRGVAELAAEEDVLDAVLEHWERPNGLRFEKRRVPLGVVAIIYESRPNVTADAAAICLRSGNGVILRGGSEAFRSNGAIVAAIQRALRSQGLPSEVVSFVPERSRAAVQALLQQERFIDVVIPRGGEGLIRSVSEHSRIPVLKHYTGVCHLYVDSSADMEKALRVCENAKVQRPGVCNAVETLLVHRAVAGDFLPQLAARLPSVELRGCAATREIIPTIAEASEEDWRTEYLDLILSLRLVDSVDEAIDHINEYGSRHTDGILSEDPESIDAFVRRVDSGVIPVNASTRFNDGSEFGKGAEIGISTDKLHARGPVAAKELTTYKYILRGDGTIRS